MVEHVKNSFESRYSAHSFSVNPGAICGRSNILLGMPGIRNHKEFSVHESHVESGIHIKENNIKVDKTIVITTELRNENRIHAFDTAPINAIGSIIAGVQGVQDLYSGVHDVMDTVGADADYEAISDAFEKYIQRENANKKEDIINALEENGASESDIATVFAALNLEENIDKSTRLQAAHSGIYFEFENEAANKSYRESETQKLLTGALNLFSEAGLCIGNLAEEYPDLLNYSLIAMQLACCGSSRLVLDFCSRETGIQEQIDGFKELLYGWVSDKIEDYFEVDHGTAEFLTSSGRFGTSFALVGCGLQNKDEIVKEAKNVVEKGFKKFGRQGKQARLKELMRDDKLGRADRGWLKQDFNAKKRNPKERSCLRVPPGKELAHRRGHEAAKGYGYDKADLKLTADHKLQHKHDNFGKLNKDAGKK